MRSSLLASLQTSEDAVSSILDMVGALIVVLDPQGRIVHFNRACETLTGFSAEEVQGRAPWDVFAPLVDRYGFREAFDQIVSEGRPYICENHWLTKKGDYRLVSWSNTVQLDPSGKVKFVIGTGVDITDRLRLEREIIEVSEEERRRIGHELHEHLCNHLAGTALMMAALAGDVRKGRRIDLDGLETVTQLIGKAIEHGRLLARGLIPVKIEEEGLVAALQEMTADVEKMAKVRCLFAAGDGLPELSHTSMATHLYRIAQEAVANAAVHAHPSYIMVRMYQTSESLILSVIDDGIGMSVDPAPSGLGLHMMRYRARMIGGRFFVGPRAEGGSEVRCAVPASGSGIMHYHVSASSHHSD